MKSAAAKGRRHLFLAAVCLVSTLLAVSSVEASRGVTTSLGPALSSPAMPDLAFEESHVEPQPRHRLFGDLDRLERPLGAVAIQKTASGVFALGIQSNVRQSGGLEQNRSGPTFQGLWTDPVTGIAYARNRWYDARTASWLSEDPLGAVDSPNLYAFVGWGPQAGRDPMGLYQEDFHFYAVYYISVLATGDTSRAARIAGASQHVDDFPGTFPARERFIDRNQEAERKKVLFPFHFMDASETGTSVSTQNLEMQTLIRGVSAGNSDIALGAALHTVADSYSHTSFSWAYGAGNNPHGGHPLLRFFAPPVGHARAGTAVDEPYKDPFLAATAGAEIYRVVREYAEGQGIDLPSRISEKELREELGVEEHRAAVVAPGRRDRTEVHGTAVAQQRRCLGRAAGGGAQGRCAPRQARAAHRQGAVRADPRARLPRQLRAGVRLGAALAGAAGRGAATGSVHPAEVRAGRGLPVRLELRVCGDRRLRRRLEVAHIKLAHSRAFLLVAYPLQTHEMLFDAHTRGFAAFGGVPRRGIYDNMKTAVDKVGRGKERTVNARFLAMTGHYLFEPEFCNRAAGWEKGVVEKNVQDRRRQLWAHANARHWPSLEALNDWLASDAGRPGSTCAIRSART